MPLFFKLKEDTLQVLWALGPEGSDGELPKHVKSGSRPLRFLLPVSKPESIPLRDWDVRLTNVSSTIFVYLRIFQRTRGWNPSIENKIYRHYII